MDLLSVLLNADDQRKIIIKTYKMKHLKRKRKFKPIQLKNIGVIIIVILIVIGMSFLKF